MIDVAAVKEHITHLPVHGKDFGVRMRTQMLVAHSAETPLKAGYAVSVTKNWLNLPTVQASINWFAGIKTMVQSVAADRGAWHATWANPVSVGYEIVGYAAFTRDMWMTDEGLEAIEREAIQMAKDAKRFGIPIRWLTTAEVNRIKNGDTTIKGFAQHRQIDPVNRSDPGNGFPYDYLLARVKARSVTAPVVVPPVIPEGETVPKTRWFAGGKPIPLVKDKWITLTDRKGHYSILSGDQASHTDNVFKGIVDNVPPGAAVEVRYIVVDWQSGQPTTIAKDMFPSGAIAGNGGPVLLSDATLMNIPKGSRYRSRIQVRAHTDGAVLTSFVSDSYYWKA